MPTAREIDGELQIGGGKGFEGTSIGHRTLGASGPGGTQSELDYNSSSVTKWNRDDTMLGKVTRPSVIEGYGTVQTSSSDDGKYYGSLMTAQSEARASGDVDRQQQVEAEMVIAMYLDRLTKHHAKTQQGMYSEDDVSGNLYRNQTATGITDIIESTAARDILDKDGMKRIVERNQKAGMDTWQNQTGVLQDIETLLQRQVDKDEARLVLDLKNIGMSNSDAAKFAKKLVEGEATTEDIKKVGAAAGSHVKGLDDKAQQPFFETLTGGIQAAAVAYGGYVPAAVNVGHLTTSSNDWNSLSSAEMADTVANYAGQTAGLGPWASAWLAWIQEGNTAETMYSALQSAAYTSGAAGSNAAGQSFVDWLGANSTSVTSSQLATITGGQGKPPTRVDDLIITKHGAFEPHQDDMIIATKGGMGGNYLQVNIYESCSAKQTAAAVGVVLQQTGLIA